MFEIKNKGSLPSAGSDSTPRPDYRPGNSSEVGQEHQLPTEKSFFNSKTKLKIETAEDEQEKNKWPNKFSGPHTGTTDIENAERQYIKRAKTGELNKALGAENTKEAVEITKDFFEKEISAKDRVGKELLKDTTKEDLGRNYEKKRKKPDVLWNNRENEKIKKDEKFFQDEFEGKSKK